MKWAKGHKSSFLLVTRNLLSGCRFLRSIAGIQKQEKSSLLQIRIPVSPIAFFCAGHASFIWSLQLFFTTIQILLDCETI